MSIHHLASNTSTTRIAAARFERRVDVWDVATTTRVGSFQTILDYGGQRLAIRPDGRQIVAGAYTRNGVACYDAVSGALQWNRKDLKRVQYLAYSADGYRVLCAADGGPARALDADTGGDVARWRGTTELVESPFQPWLLLHRKNLDVTSFTGELVARIPRETFAALDVAFAPEHLAISESGGAVRCFHLPSGRCLWRYAPPQGHHVLQLAALATRNRFAGVIWPYKQGGPKRLVHFRDDGRPEVIAILGTVPETTFVESLGVIVLSDGRVVDVASGDARDRLPFEDARAPGA
jgi:hypothetical protein